MAASPLRLALGFDLVCDTKPVNISEARSLCVARGSHDSVALLQKQARQIGREKDCIKPEAFGLIDMAANFAS